jgi:tetratricopeptide (TPR) repeat protein
LEALTGLNVPALIVLDYAETRPALLSAIAQAAAALQAKVRLLLLTRTSGDWRQSTAADHEGLSWLPDAAVLNLQALESGVAGRSAAWREAVTGLARNLGPITDISSTIWADHATNVLARPPNWWSDGTVQASALGIHVNALAALLTEADPGLVGASAMATLLLHERRYWRRAAAARGLILHDITAEGAVAANTLWAANTEDEALTIVGAVRGLRDQTEDRRYAAVHWLASLYPAEGQFWGTLQPDRLGEYHVGTQLAHRPELLLAPSAVASKFQAEHALTVLTRAAPDHPHLSKTIYAVVSAAPIVFGPAAVVSALQAADPTPLLEALTAFLETPASDDEAAVRLLRNLEVAVPSNTHVLRQFAVKIADNLAAVYRRLAETNADAYLPDVAGALNNLSYRLSYVSRHDEALDAAQEAVALYRRLAETNADAYLPDVAGALNNLSYRLSYVSRHDEAVGAAQEAVALYRRLAETNADAYLPDVAGALNNLSNQLSRLRHRNDEALDAAQEAVALYRRLAETNADAYLPDVAGALNNLSTSLSRRHRRDEAVAGLEEALDIYRRLAEPNPDAYLPDVARTLNNLSNQLSRLRRHDEAVAAAQEALDTYRRLAETHIDAYLPDVARTLYNLSLHLKYNSSSHSRRRDEAVAAAQEALEIYRRLAETTPDINLPKAAKVLIHLAEMFVVSEGGEAVSVLEEAISIYQGLAQHRPETYLPDVASALIRLSNLQAGLGHRLEAAAASEQAVHIYRPLAQARPDAYLPSLGRVLSDHCQRLSGLGWRAEAVAASKEAVASYRCLAEASPDRHLPALPGPLIALADQMVASGRNEEAAAAYQEAVAIRRCLAEASPDRHLPALPGLLIALADQMVASGRNEEAAAAYQEAVAIRRCLAEANPDRHLPALPGLLIALADQLVASGRNEEAAAAYQEAVTCIASHYNRQPSAGTGKS